jgi:molybdopterin/thiamine biosynthesis adenylyltransferase
MSLQWWRRGAITLEDERVAFGDAGLDFELDQTALDHHQVVVFRGALRRGEHRHPAVVIYPPSYVDGGHPLVFAKGLDLGRHSDADSGLLCLDHLDPNEHRPMNGATAVVRAEALWRLTVEDPEALTTLEADAPDPTLAKYRAEPGSSVFLIGADVTGFEAGWARIKGYPMPFANSDGASPIRGQIVGLGANTVLGGDTLFDTPVITSIAGSHTILGVWRRVEAPPPWRSRQQTLDWVAASQRPLLEHAVAVGRVHQRLNKGANWTFIALAFPDEMKVRGEKQDAWLLAACHLNTGKMVLVPVSALQPDDVFDRQPGMRPLAGKTVDCVGIGALGSEIVDLLGRAGVGRIDLVDPDDFTPGNVVRHALTLHEAGWLKTVVMRDRLRSVNPFVEGIDLPVRAGAAAWPLDSNNLREECMDALVGADLIVNATADQVTARWLAGYADSVRVPVLHTAISAGAWSARSYLQRPGSSGCPECLGLHQRDEDDVVPPWEEDLDGFGVVGLGCNQPTFSAPAFEVVEAAAAATRMTVQMLLEGEGYPTLAYDMATVVFRDAESSRPATKYTKLPRHPECSTCAP